MKRFIILVFAFMSIFGTVLRLKGMDIDAIYCVAYGAMVLAYCGAIER